MVISTFLQRIFLKRIFSKKYTTYIKYVVTKVTHNSYTILKNTAKNK